MTDYSKYDYSKLFTPMQIGSMTVKNRLVMSPMGTFTPMQDGTESEEGIAYYERRAKGGLGMIIIGAMFLSEKTAQGGPTYALWTTRAIPKMTVLTERVHRWNARIVCQISPGTGRNGMPDIGERVPISSSANPSFYNPNMICRPLETEEIKQIVEECRTAAINARMAGFDAIELHSHAGYLFDQFLSPIWNTRTDEYGGSLENRCRFSVECIKAIRESCPGMPILYRIALDHRFTGGRTLEDSLPILKILDEAGADAFDVDAGSYEAMDYIFPTTYVGEADPYRRSDRSCRAPCPWDKSPAASARPMPDFWRAIHTPSRSDETRDPPPESGASYKHARGLSASECSGYPEHIPASARSAPHRNIRS